MKTRPLTAGESLIIGCLLTLAASVWLWTHSRFPESALIVCPGIAFTAMLGLGIPGMIQRLRSALDRSPALIAAFPSALWLLYLGYAAGLGIAEPKAAAVMALYLSGPFIAFAPRFRPGLKKWIEPAMILWLWLPIELGLIRRLLSAGQGADLHYAFGQLLAIDAGIIAFGVCNRTDGIGYRLEWNRDIGTTALKNFLLFALLAIPLGLRIHFIEFSFHLPKLIPAAPLFLGIFLFTALPEEFLFRGLIQNWFQRTIAKPRWSQALAAIVFGASHLNNGPPVPNYKYFLLASIAGVFYGRAWRSTGSLTCSALTHALVDTCWSIFFR